MITSCLRHVHIDGLAAALRAIVIIIDVLLYRLDPDRNGARLHEGLHVPHHDVLGGPQVPEFAIDDAAVVSCAHALCMRLLGVYYEGTGPEVHIVQDGTRLDEASPVHIFQDANAVHGDHRSQTEADEGDGLTFGEIRL